MPFRDEPVPPVFNPGEFLIVDSTPPPGFWRRVFLRKPPQYVPYACGHLSLARFTLFIRGERRELNDAFFKERPLCHTCIRMLTIRCACCGESIMPGESVACVVEDPKWLKPHATRASPNTVVICYRRTCAGPYPEMGGGFWNGREVASSWDFSGTAKDP